MKLRTAIREGSKELSELNFRKPTGKDVRQCGVPVNMEMTASGARIPRIDTEAIAKYISALTQIPPSTVDQMDALDFSEAIGIIAGFFEEAEKTSSTAAGNSPASSQESTPSN